MKKLFLFLFVIASLNTLAQTTVAGDRVVARQSLFVRDWWVDSVLRDTNFMNKVRSVPTADAVYRFVTNRIAGGVGDLSGVLANSNTASNDIYLYGSFYSMHPNNSLLTRIDPGLVEIRGQWQTYGGSGAHLRLNRGSDSVLNVIYFETQGLSNRWGIGNLPRTSASPTNNFSLIRDLGGSDDSIYSVHHQTGITTYFRQLRYSANYGSLFNSRTLVDKGYVDSLHVAGGGAIQTFQQTLTAGSRLTTNNKVLGGNFNYVMDSVKLFIVSGSNADTGKIALRLDMFNNKYKFGDVSNVVGGPVMVVDANTGLWTVSNPSGSQVVARMGLTGKVELGEVTPMGGYGTTMSILPGTTGNVDFSNAQAIRWGTDTVATRAYARSAGGAGGGGNVSKVGTPVNNQIGVWTGDGTLKGSSVVSEDGTNLIVTNAIRAKAGLANPIFHAGVASDNAGVTGIWLGPGANTHTTANATMVAENSYTILNSPSTAPFYIGINNTYALQVKTNRDVVITSLVSPTTYAPFNVLGKSYLEDELWIANTTDQGDFKAQVGGNIFTTGQLTMATQFTPANSTDATHPNKTITIDDSFLYYRTSTGTWKKIALATF